MKHHSEAPFEGIIGYIVKIVAEQKWGVGRKGVMGGIIPTGSTFTGH